MENQASGTKKTILCNGKIIDFKVPKVMGILNVTPDSFYDGGKYNHIDSIQMQIEKYIELGVDIIDVGAYSSRPGAANIDPGEEKNRLKPVLELLAKSFASMVVSIDTFRAGIASWAVKEFSVSIINDISSGDMDNRMFETIADLQVPYSMMHMQGTPANMQLAPVYQNVVEDIIYYFSEKTEKLRSFGIHDIIIDPGFGFGKTIQHNYQLLNNLQEFKLLGLPILVGLSRKSFIYKVLGNTPNEALNGTSVLNTIALLKGADIIRVHDVLEAKQCVQLVQQCFMAN
jgi:dihydropteroate synthase